MEMNEEEEEGGGGGGGGGRGGGGGGGGGGGEGGVEGRGAVSACASMPCTSGSETGCHALPYDVVGTMQGCQGDSQLGRQLETKTEVFAAAVMKHLWRVQSTTGLDTEEQQLWEDFKSKLAADKRAGHSIKNVMYLLGEFTKKNDEELLKVIDFYNNVIWTQLHSQSSEPTASVEPGLDSEEQQLWEGFKSKLAAAKRSGHSIKNVM